MNRNDQLAKNSLILGMGTLVPKALSFLILPILTGYVTPVEYGQYDLILSISSLVVPIVTLQIQQAVFRFMISATARDRGRYASTSLAFVVAVSVGYAPFVAAGLWVYGFAWPVIGASCLLVAGNALYLVVGQMLRGMGNNVVFTLGTIVYSVVNLAFVVSLVYLLRLGLFGVVASVACSYVVSSLYMLLVALRHVRVTKSDVSWATLRELLQFSAPIIPSSVSLWVVNLSDRFLIVYFLGEAANGIYSIASKIPLLYSAAYNIFSLSWTEIASRVKDEDTNPDEYYSEMFNKLFVFLVGVMLVVISASPLLYEFFIDAAYAEAYYQTAIQFFGVFFNSLVSFYAGIYIAMKRTKEIGFTSMVGAVVNVVVNLALIRSIGLYAASVSTAVSYLAIALYRAYDLSKVVSIAYNKRQIALGMAAFVVCSVLFYVRSVPAIAVCVCIAIVYNLRHNLYLARWFARKLLRRGDSANS